jgi:integrase
MASLPWQELPPFMTELELREGVSAHALRFIILTAGRSGEARGAQWSEVKGNVWTVPENRMKTGKSHRVPLSPEAVAVLDEMRGLDSIYIFPSPNPSKNNKSKPLSDTVFKALMGRMNWNGLTTHGFRSTFRVWCSESAHADREVAEAALSHVLGNKVERAYARSDHFDRRRALMENWSRYATGQLGKVVQLVKV